MARSERSERSVREALLQKIDSKKMSHIRTTSKKKYVPYPRFPDFSIIRTTSQKKYAPFPKYFFHRGFNEKKIFPSFCLKLAITELTKSMFPWVKVLVNHVFLSKIFHD